MKRELVEERSGAATLQVSRRSLLISLAAGAGAAAAVYVPSWHSPSPVGPRGVTRLSAPAVVVGSGYGGAVAAHRLAQAGLTTLVLERGRRWELKPEGGTFGRLANPLTGRPSGDGRLAWLADRYNMPPMPSFPIERYVGVLETIRGRGITVLVGAGVGGGSLVSGGVLSQPPREALRASLPASVDLDELAREYFPRARRMLGASPMPDGVLKTPTYEAHRTAILEASRSGLRWERLEAGIDWDAVYRELRGEAPRSVVIGSYTFTGADSGALNSVDRNYLRLAEQSGRARVMPLHRVKLVRKLARGYELQVERLAENGEVLEEFVVECGALFLAAGSLGTTGLLFRSRRNGLKVNEHLGSSWGTNGVVIGQRLNIGPLGSIRGPFGPVAGGPPVVLVEQPDNPAGVTTLEYAGVYGEMMTIGMTVAAAGAGRLVYLPGQDETVPVWPVEAQSACRAAVAAVNKVLDAMPPGPQGPRLGRARIGLESQPGTAHPLGGAVLDQVCDGVGQVRGQEGLFVCDGALIPGCTGARNPALTITALAERNLDRILPTLTRLAGG